MSSVPQVIILAGPNGAGKTTASSSLIPGITFVNADEIAKGLSSYPSKGADIMAGRILLERLDELESQRADFAVETTLASRVLATRVVRLRNFGYHFRLIFLFIPAPELAVLRVAGRVLLGGHHIPEETIRRRYGAGIRNFFDLYQPIADKWGVYDTTSLGPPKLIAEGIMGQPAQIHEKDRWNQMRQRYRQ